MVSLSACADDDVVFPPTMDAGNDAEAGLDVSIDRGMDAGSDVAPDISTDPVVDVGPDGDRVDVNMDTTPPDDTESDVPGSDDAPPDALDDADVDDDAHDATSEEAGTCGSRCASGVCDMNGDCTPCVRDAECTGGRVCNAGSCGPRCGDGGVACTGNLVCCVDHCVDITRDPQNCGMCAMTCAATQFCGNASTPVCKDNILRNICNTKRATFLLDGLADDDAASAVIRTAIASLCIPVPVLTSIGQDQSTAINTSTGQPLVGGGELLVAAGGDSTQLLVRYLETSGTSSIYNQTDGVTQLDFRRRGGAPDGGDSVVRAVPLSTIHASHDFFVVYVVKDPVTGTLSLVVYGIDSPGTRAGAFYFANVILPDMVQADMTAFTQAWYLYEWTSADDAGAGPSTADTFTQIAAGL
jgi:hypothetical protein